MTNSSDRRPFSMPYVQHVNNVAQGTNTMIARAPWPSPVSKYFILRKLVVSLGGPANVQSVGVLNIWDQDLSNTTPLSRGSAGGPLLQVPLIPVSIAPSTFSGTTSFNPSMTVLDIDTCPQEQFWAGITVNTTFSGVSMISFEADVI